MAFSCVLTSITLGAKSFSLMLEPGGRTLKKILIESPSLLQLLLLKKEETQESNF